MRQVVKDSMKKIRVLHIHTLPVISGSGLNTFLTMSKMDLNRYAPELACAPGGRLVELVESKGFRVRPINNFVRPISLLRDISAFFELVSLIKKEKYDIVHTHNSKAGIIGRLAAKMAGVPVIIHTVHGFAFHPYEKFWRRKIFVFLERLSSRWCDAMIAISDALIDWAIKEKICNKNKLFRIYSGIETDKFSCKVDIKAIRAEFGIKDEESVVGEVAKLWRGKGQEVLINAVPEILKSIPNLKVMFVGEGELEKELKNIAENLNITDKIIFAGFRTDMPEVNSIMDIACLPSLWEGMGRSILEAMACGKPVVASKVGGIVDLVKDGINGILVPPGDSKELASAIIKLLKDKELRLMMGEQARKTIDERFSAKKMVSDIESVYAGLLKRKGMT